MSICALEGCNKQARRRFCCNKHKDRYHNLNNPRGRFAHLNPLEFRRKRSPRPPQTPLKTKDEMHEEDLDYYYETTHPFSGDALGQD